MDKRIEKLYHKMRGSAVDIDSHKTAMRLREIRRTEKELIKYVCRHSRLFKSVERHEKNKGAICRNNYDCKNCRLAKNKTEEKALSGQVATREASMPSLGLCYGKDGKAIYELEHGSSVTWMNVLSYAYIAKLPITEVIQLRDGFYFDENGVIRRVGDPEYTKLDEVES